MNEYDFTLTFELPDNEADPDRFVDALYDAGCDDASVGIGQRGSIALNFIREAATAFDAVSSAITNVKSAIPGVRLIEATPDFVGLTDIAEIIGCSRQNVRKLVITHQSSFPTPIHEGQTSLWNLAKVLQWLKARGTYTIDDALIEVSNANMQFNIARQLQSMDPSFRAKIPVLRELTM